MDNIQDKLQQHSMNNGESYFSILFMNIII
jgi:hypothetical protein